MKGLQNSRWAAREAHNGRSSPVPSPSRRPHTAEKKDSDESIISDLTKQPPDPENATGELSRYAKIVRRMKWKLPFLDLAYRKATVATDQDDAEREEAELMFKLDFFEYYMLCERALVHLQGVFGITIPRGISASTAVGNKNRTQVHRYHANVLESLDHKDNPLYHVLGRGNVRWQLARAKDLRNRWKNVDDDAGITSIRYSKAAEAPPLAAYNLAGILSAIHEGLDHAFVIARDFVITLNSQIAQHGSSKTTATDMAIDEDQHVRDENEWGFIVEAMDWEAV